MDLRLADQEPEWLTNRQLSTWREALLELHEAAFNLAHQWWPADNETLLLLTKLARHPNTAVRLKATAAILGAGWVPPYDIICEMLAGGRPSSITGMEMIPSQFQRQIIGHKCHVWECFCVALAQQMYGRILTAQDSQTLCSDGAKPDIVVDDGSITRSEGRIRSADRIIDAKCSTSARGLHKYADRCAHLELWFATEQGRERYGSETHVGSCHVTYRWLSDLVATAKECDRTDLADGMSVFSFGEGRGETECLVIYLRLLKAYMESRPTFQELRIDEVAPLMGPNLKS